MNAPVLLTASEMQAVDARAIAAGADGFRLMCRAGEAVARHVRRRVSRAASVVIVAGSGNNGGDGAIAAASLAASEHAVLLVRVGGAARPGSDAERAFQQWHGHTLCVGDEVPLPNAVQVALARADLIVDALFGAGLSRPIGGEQAAMVQAINEACAEIIAIDLPSGLNGDTHAVDGPVVEAALTIAFERAKPAHCLYPGRALCGDVVIEPIGMPKEALAQAPTTCRMLTPAAFRDQLPLPTPTTHKFVRGHVLVRGGPLAQTGAARLSATAALASGAGLVTLASPRDAMAVNAAQLTAVMLREADSPDRWRELLADERLRAVVVGPGNGLDAATADAVDAAIESGHACVIDADGLSCHRQAAALFIERLQACPTVAVLTPHDGEFARLFGHTDITEQPSRLHKARAASVLSGSIIVSKGADTVVAAPDGRAVVGVNAPPWLATAGAGDVLAGLIASLLAQGMPPFDAASAAVWLHGEAARQLSWPMTAESLPSTIAKVLARQVNLAAPAMTQFAAE